MNKTGGFLVKELEEFEIDEILEIQKLNNLSYWSLTDYLNFIENKQIVKLVVKDRNQVIGFAIMRLISLEADDYLFDKYSAKIPLVEGEIYNIGVHNLYKRGGIGTLLIKKLIQNRKIQTLKTIWLEVRESNHPAINFYKKNNFKKIHIRKNYYNNPQEDAIVMKIDLRGPSKPI